MPVVRLEAVRSRTPLVRGVQQQPGEGLQRVSGWFLMLCALCGSESGQSHTHDSCQAEFTRRSDAKLCVFCGGADAQKDAYWCDACWKADDPPYDGYPPGGR